MKTLVLVFGQTDRLTFDDAQAVLVLFKKYLPETYQIFLFDYGEYARMVSKIIDPTIRLDRCVQTPYTCGDTFLRTEDLRGRWGVKPGFMSVGDIIRQAGGRTWLIADSCSSSGLTICHIIKEIRKSGSGCSDVFVGVLSSNAMKRMQSLEVNVHYMNLFEEGRIIEIKDILSPEEEFFFERGGVFE